MLKGYLRSVSETATWNQGQCLPAFPSSGDHKDVEILQNLVKNTRRIIPSGIPLTEVDDPNPMGRLEETLAGRRELCVYDERMQNLPIVHFQCNHKKRLRMLVHFYVSPLLYMAAFAATTSSSSDFSMTPSRPSCFLRIGRKISG